MMAKKENSKVETVENTENKAQIENVEKNVERKEIEKIKSDVDKLSQELKTAMNELKKSIVDIRSAVSEIENPFNLLRAVSSERDLKKLNGERLPPGVKSLFLGKPEEEAEEKAEQKSFEPSPSEEEKETLETEQVQKDHLPSKPEQVRAEHFPSKPEPSSEHPFGTVYLDWVWSLLDLGFSPDDIRQLAQSYEFLGFLPPRSTEQIYSLAIAAEKAKSKGLTKNKLLLNMYKASVISGIGIGLEDLKNIIFIAEGKYRKVKRVV